MRTVLPVVVVALLLTAGVAAQNTPATGAKIPEAQAKSIALQRVQTDFDAGKLRVWGDPHVKAQGSDGCCKGDRALFNPTGGKDGGGAYVVLVGREGAKGQVRVIVDATSGAVLSSVHRDFGGATPDWWVKGLNAPPAGRR